MSGKQRKIQVWTAEEDRILRETLSHDDEPDFERAAELLPNRSLSTIRKHWRYTLDPKIKSGAWTAEEDAILLKEHGKHGNAWSKIAKMLPGRTYLQVRQRFMFTLNPDIKKELWSDEEDRVLREAYDELGDQWALISKRLPGRTEKQVRQRYTSALGSANGVKTQRRYFSRTPWSEEENERLREAVEEFNGNFGQIASLFPNRTTSQVRTHWMNALDTSIKHGPWTEEEDVQLFKAWREHGNHWAEISSMIQGRPPCAVRRRWNAKLFKVIAGRLYRSEGRLDFREARDAVAESNFVEEDENWHYEHRNEQNYVVFTRVLEMLSGCLCHGDLLDEAGNFVLPLTHHTMGKSMRKGGRRRSGGSKSVRGGKDVEDGDEGGSAMGEHGRRMEVEGMSNVAGMGGLGGMEGLLGGYGSGGGNGIETHMQQLQMKLQLQLRMQMQMQMQMEMAKLRLAQQMQAMQQESQQQQQGQPGGWQHQLLGELRGWEMRVEDAHQQQQQQQLAEQQAQAQAQRMALEQLYQQQGQQVQQQAGQMQQSSEMKHLLPSIQDVMQSGSKRKASTMSGWSGASTHSSSSDSSRPSTPDEEEDAFAAEALRALGKRQRVEEKCEEM